MNVGVQVFVVAALAAVIIVSYGGEWRWAVGGAVMAVAVWLLGKASLQRRR